MFEKNKVQTVERLQLGIQVDGYPGALGHVFNNLISNALLHAFDGAGGGTITVTARSDGNGAARIEFRDDGSGIAPEILGRIYDPFYSSKIGRGGSGLGLYIVHTLVVGALGGDISVTSDVGAGTAFVIVLPTTAPQPAQVWS
jgi:signal transduction histidine kinase